MKGHILLKFKRGGTHERAHEGHMNEGLGSWGTSGGHVHGRRSRHYTSSAVLTGYSGNARNADDSGKVIFLI